VLGDRRLMLFAACALLFTLANAPLLPLASTGITKSAGNAASLMIAACIVLPQAIVALIAPGVGWFAERRGRRIVLVCGFAMLPMRALLFAAFDDPVLRVLAQAFDGLAAAVFGVLVPLVVADLTARSGHFNFSLGVVGFAVGIGGTLSPPLAGWIADHAGEAMAFLALAAVGAAAMLLALVMPETRPRYAS
jgi:MFS family permease